MCAATGCPTHTTGGCTAVSHVARSVEGRLRCRVRGGGRAVVVVWLLLVVAVKGVAVVDLPLRVVCCSAHKWSGPGRAGGGGRLLAVFLPAVGIAPIATFADSSQAAHQSTAAAAAAGTRRAAHGGCQSILRPRQQREAAWHWSHADQEQRCRAAAVGPGGDRREQRPLAVPCPRTCHAMRDPAVQLRRAQLLLECGGWLLRRRRGDSMRREQLHRPPVRGAVVRDLPGRCACSADMT